MKFTTGLLLIAPALLISIYSFPTTGDGKLFDSNHVVEYSLEELNTYFDMKESETSSYSKRQVHRILDAKVDATSSPVEQSLAGNINLSQEVFLDYDVCCSATQRFHEIFNFMILYNGKDVTYRKIASSNIDAWGKVFVGAIHPGQPIYTEVPFQYTLCRPVSRTEVCTYHFSGIAQAEIVYYGKTPGITPSAVQPGANPKAAYVSQTCNDKPGPNGKIPCPTPSGSKCWLAGIAVDKTG